MINKLLPLLFVLLSIPGILTAAEPHTLEIEFSFNAPDFSDKHLLGYRLYKEGLQVCEATDYTAASITCDITAEDGTFNFTLTGYYSDNSESPHSPSFPFTIDSTPFDPPLQAETLPTAQSGEVPLNISFSGTNSTGAISSYSWNFGDGGTAAGSSTSHTYSLPGSYSATLTVTDENGITSVATTTITALESTTTPVPPTAVLSSTTAAGNAPLPVSFDGSSSTANNPPIVKYHWNFGDGAEATGITASHAYSTAGTYHAELTVTDNLGLTGKIDTPIIVLGSSPINQNPAAVIIVTGPVEGIAPFLTSFDGSQSSDPDGTINRYDWNFGDGVKGTGPMVQHTYIDDGNYALSLKVTDNLGETATVTKQIICNSTPHTSIPNFEAGEVVIDVDDGWVAVNLVNSFVDPVVIAGPPTANDSDPVLVRIRNITAESFEIHLREWDYLDGVHASEKFSYIVMEKGTYTLDDGIKVEAGSFTGSSRFKKTILQQSYDNVPVILTQVTTDNDTSAVTGRTRNSGQNSFEYKLQEQESTKNAHAEETIGYIAWEPGAGEIQGVLFEAGLTSKSVTEKWFGLIFQPLPFSNPPLFIADMQTYDDRDPAALRTQDTSKLATRIMAEEEESKNTKINHNGEVVGFLVIGSAIE